MSGLSRSLLAELPWDSLASQLSPSAKLVDGSPEKFLEECTQLFRDEGFPIMLSEGSQYDLNAQPSGLCTNTMFCGFERCSPSNASSLYAFAALFEPTAFGTAPQIVEELIVPENSRYNVPIKVLHPRTAGDVAAAVTFADEHGVEVSVKNAGNSYSGSATNKDSLLVYTQPYKKYSQNSIQECTDEDEEEMNDDLSNMPCKLALARGRPAAVRVGGGENFNELYGSVKQFNEEQKNQTGAYKYHVLGGGAATVTPMGWSWQGGLGGTTMGRTLGFGADQVLQLEMILPDGSHVKFGPSEWEAAEGYVYPKTTKVSGVCNKNPSEEDESLWEWGACTNDISFDDLWFAVRGGGGGAWGVVLSVHLQLHDYPGELQKAIISDATFPVTVGSGCNETEAKCTEYFFEIIKLYVEFFFDFYNDPAAANITQEQSNLCGQPDVAAFYCYSGGGDILLSAWKDYVMSKKGMLEDKGVPDLMVELAANHGGYESIPDYAEDVLLQDGPWAGNGNDSPRPSPQGYTAFGNVNALVPKALMLKNRNDWIPFLTTFMLGGQVPYVAHPDKADDQASSLSNAHREAAWMMTTTFDSPLLEVLFGLLFGEMDHSSDFPGFLGSNHLGPNTFGPLKDDWTKPCPAEWTWEKSAEMCISPMEAVYGTERLGRLERIKADVDPKHTFRCYNCISPAPAAPAPTPAAPADQMPTAAAPIEPSPTEPAPTQASAPTEPEGTFSGAMKGEHFLFVTLVAIASTFVAAI